MRLVQHMFGQCSFLNPPSIIIQVAQVVALTLGISLEMIKVMPSNTFTNPNGQTTGASITSEVNCFVRTAKL